MEKQKQTINLGKKKIVIKKNGLRNALKLEPRETFEIKELKSINKTPVGEKFNFRGRSFKMTNLMKKRITLAITLMKMRRRK